MKKIFFLIGLACFAFWGCSDDNEALLDAVETNSPVITLDSDTGIYSVKTGREITITPTYEYVTDQALYIWKLDGTIIGRDTELTFSSDETGRYYIYLTVSTEYGTTEVEMRVDVVEKEIPYVTLAGTSAGFETLIGVAITFSPTVTTTSLETTYEWTVNGEVVSTELEYTFQSDEAGEYTITFTATNEDGSDSIEFTLTNANPEDLPFSWVFEQTEYNMSYGRYIRLMPLDITNAFDVTYTWTMSGSTLQEGEDYIYVFTPSSTGTYTLTVTAEGPYLDEAISQELTVNVYPYEAYYNAATSESSAYDVTVYEVLCAPGQFVSQFTATTMAEAISQAQAKIDEGAYVSLGTFGGYIVVGFDHSVDNSGDYDFAIRGNSFNGSSEPGIVWVMQDENGDGEPNDTWYELKGSEYGAETTIQDYAVTFYKASSGQPIPWTDNQGNTGQVGTVVAPTYPTWVSTDSYTLRGTCLEARNEDTSGNGTYWVNPSYEWGYVDNYSSIDRITGDTYNFFRISDAVTFDGEDANLSYIDFIKVQVGLNTESGWLGEVSTEVFGYWDYNLTK